MNEQAVYKHSLPFGTRMFLWHGCFWTQDSLLIGNSENQDKGEML